MANRPDTITADEVLQRARSARGILNDPVSLEAFEAADALFVEEWRLATNPVEREAAWGKMRGLEEVRRFLQVFVSDGEFTAAKLKVDL